MKMIQKIQDKINNKKTLIKNSHVIMMNKKLNLIYNNI